MKKSNAFRWQYLTNRRSGKATAQIVAAFQKYCLDHLGEEVIFTVTDCGEIKHLRNFVNKFLKCEDHLDFIEVQMEYEDYINGDR